MTKLDDERNKESWKPIYFGSKGQGHESLRETLQNCRRGSLHSCECWLLLADSAAGVHNSHLTIYQQSYLTNSRMPGPRSLPALLG